MKHPVVRDGFANTDNFPGIDFSGDPGLTDQSQAADCDVNLIVDRFMKTGILPGVDIERTYGDFSNPHDFHAAMDIVAQANEQFAGLTAQVRKRFNNDPSTFLEFINDPDSGPEAVKLGLATLRPQTDASAPPAPAVSVSEPISKPAPAKAAKKSSDD